MGDRNPGNLHKFASISTTLLQRGVGVKFVLCYNPMPKNTAATALTFAILTACLLAVVPITTTTLQYFLEPAQKLNKN